MKSIPNSSISLGDPRSQFSQPLRISNSSHGPPKYLTQEPWGVTTPIHRNTWVEIQDEIPDDVPDLERTQLPEVANTRKRRISLSLLSSGQHISPPPLTEKEMAPSLDPGLHDHAAQIRDHADDNLLGFSETENQVSLKSAATRGKPLKSILGSRFPSSSSSFCIQSLNES